MIRHYFIITMRNLTKYKGSFIINLTGLSTGLACALFIYLWVSDEKQFDKFHENDKNLYQVMELSTENNETIVHEATQGPLAEAMKKELPEVAAAVQVFSIEKSGFKFNLKVKDKSIKTTLGVFAGKDFFNVFSFPLLIGSKEQVLNEKTAIVISENLAKNLFGSADASVGKIVEYEIVGKKMEVQVTGVFKTLPSNSSLQFDVALTQASFLTDFWTGGTEWTNQTPNTYLLLKSQTDVAKFNTKIKNFIQQFNKGTQYSLFVRSYSSAYLYGHYENGVQSGGRSVYVSLFSFVALFILIIACINFMNLSTAKASRRLKEVGIKKAVGSSRSALVYQFLLEAVVMAFLSLTIACVIVVVLLPAFNQITGKTLSIDFSLNFAFLVLATTLLTGLLSGSYPAFYLSGFNPIAILKGKIKNSFGELLARKGLVILQFVISTVLIVSVMVIYRQVNFMQSKNLGYNKDNVIVFDKEGAVMQNTNVFIQELKQIPGILNASAIDQSIVQSGVPSSTYGIKWEGKSDKDLVNFAVFQVDYDLIETLGLQLKEGRAFSKQFGSDSTQLIFNEAAIKAMGLKQAIGAKISMWDTDMQVAGIVKDFHINSLHEAIVPMVFKYAPSSTMMIMAKIAKGKELETIASLQDFYKKYNPGYLLDFKFLDANYQSQYISEQRISQLSKYFAGLAILISCLGLFGLAAFNAEARTKEIGIRKVLGATVGNVAFLLSKDLFKLVIIAELVAFPLAWWAMLNWLNNFAYKVDLSVFVFVLTFFAIVLVTLVVVSFQAIKAGIANPIKSLRTE
jgi:putative ABC transport system permease protein